jgi:adenine-specific DNA glycosylase
LLAGLWAFPEANTDLDSGSDGGDARRAQAVGEGLGCSPLTAAPALDPKPHVFTHLRAHSDPVVVQLGVLAPLDGSDQRWVDLTGLTGLALPVAQRKIARAAARVLGC